jgi:hypothetical protein
MLIGSPFDRPEVLEVKAEVEARAEFELFICISAESGLSDIDTGLVLGSIVGPRLLSPSPC